MIDLSISIQAKNLNILKSYKLLNAFKEKLHLWCRRVKRDNVAIFQPLLEVTDKDESLIPSVDEEILKLILPKLFDGCFRVWELETFEEQIINPYSFEVYAGWWKVRR